MHSRGVGVTRRGRTIQRPNYYECVVNIAAKLEQVFIWVVFVRPKVCFVGSWPNTTTHSAKSG